MAFIKNNNAGILSNYRKKMRFGINEDKKEQISLTPEGVLQKGAGNVYYTNEAGDIVPVIVTDIYGNYTDLIRTNDEEDVKDGTIQFSSGQNSIPNPLYSDVDLRRFRWEEFIEYE